MRDMVMRNWRHLFVTATLLGLVAGCEGADDDGEVVLLQDDAGAEVGTTDAGQRDAGPGDVAADTDPADADEGDTVSDTDGPSGGRIVFEGTDYTLSEWEVAVSGELSGSKFESNDQINGDGTASGTIQAPLKKDVLDYTGQIERLDYDGTVRVIVDGDIRHGGPEILSQSKHDGQIIRMTLYSSLKLLRNNGRVSERMVARYAAEAFDDAGYDFEIVFNLRPQTPPDEKSNCSAGEAPGWWKARTRSGELEELRKDVNVLMLNANGGGCGAVGGRYGTTPARNIDEEREWQPTGYDDWNRNMHGTLHEIGHQLGASHDHSDQADGKQHWGRGWNEDDPDNPDVDGFWHRTPNVAGNGAPSACGTMIEERKYETAMRHQLYSDCAAQRFIVKKALGL